MSELNKWIEIQGNLFFVSNIEFIGKIIKTDCHLKNGLYIYYCFDIKINGTISTIRSTAIRIKEDPTYNYRRKKEQEITDIRNNLIDITGINLD
jgi:hypothetical protein